MARTVSLPYHTAQTLAIIGCGTMGSAILSGVLESCAETRAAGDEPRFARFIATCQSEGSAVGLRERFASYLEVVDIIRGDNIKAMDTADVILFAFKPYMIDLVLKNVGVRDALEGKLVISVLAGSPLEKIEKAIFCAGPRTEEERRFFIKRAMPNVAAKFRESMTVIEASSDMPHQCEELSEWIFLQLGKIQVVSPELYDVGGVLAGSAGALFTVAFDGMLDGAVSQGLKRADAKKILTQQLFSLAKLLENEHPAVLRESISSPKGTTIAGLLSLEEDRARYAYTRAINASSNRSKEIGKQA